MPEGLEVAASDGRDGCGLGDAASIAESLRLLFHHRVHDFDGLGVSPSAVDSSRGLAGSVGRQLVCAIEFW